MSLLQKLAELANDLDSKGYFIEAAEIDQVLKEAANQQQTSQPAKQNNAPANNVPKPTPAPAQPTPAPAQPTPPVANQTNTQQPVQKATDMSWDDDKKDLGKEWDEIEEKLKDLPEKYWPKIKNMMESNMSKLNVALDKHEQKADDVREMPPAEAPKSLPAPHIDTKKNAPDTSLGKKEEKGPEADDGKTHGVQLPKVHDPKTASSLSISKNKPKDLFSKIEALIYRIYSLEDHLKTLKKSDEKAQLKSKIDMARAELKRLEKQMQGDDADGPRDMPPAETPKSLPGPGGIETNPNQPDPKLPPKKDEEQHAHDPQYVNFKKRLDNMFNTKNIPHEVRKSKLQDTDALLKELYQFEESLYGSNDSKSEEEHKHKVRHTVPGRNMDSGNYKKMPAYRDLDDEEIKKVYHD